MGNSGSSVKIVKSGKFTPRSSRADMTGAHRSVDLRLKSALSLIFLFFLNFFLKFKFWISSPGKHKFLIIIIILHFLFHDHIWFFRNLWHKRVIWFFQPFLYRDASRFYRSLFPLSRFFPDKKFSVYNPFFVNLTQFFSVVFVIYKEIDPNKKSKLSILSFVIFSFKIDVIL